MAAKKKKNGDGELSVTPPRLHVLHQRIVGTAPFVQARFPEKARQAMRDKHEAGSTAKKGAKREARDFEDDYRQSMYLGPNGECGIPASAFRAAAVSACRLVGFQMTLGKLSIFVEDDFVDPRDGTPLVAIHGEPRSFIAPVRNASGVCDLRCRAQWMAWSCNLRIKYDADQFKLSDVVNLLTRIGTQVGVGEGRPDSKKSCGCGWGTFRLDGDATVEEIVFSA